MLNVIDYTVRQGDFAVKLSSAFIQHRLLFISATYWWCVYKLHRACNVSLYIAEMFFISITCLNSRSSLGQHFINFNGLLLDYTTPLKQNCSTMFWAIINGSIFKIIKAASRRLYRDVILNLCILECIRLRNLSVRLRYNIVNIFELLLVCSDKQ